MKKRKKERVELAEPFDVFEQLTVGAGHLPHEPLSAKKTASLPEEPAAKAAVHMDFEPPYLHRSPAETLEELRHYLKQDEKTSEAPAAETSLLTPAVSTAGADRFVNRNVVEEDGEKGLPYWNTFF